MPIESFVIQDPDRHGTLGYTVWTSVKDHPQELVDTFESQTIDDLTFSAFYGVKMCWLEPPFPTDTIIYVSNIRVDKVKRRRGVGSWLLKTLRDQHPTAWIVLMALMDQDDWIENDNDLDDNDDGNNLDNDSDLDKFYKKNGYTLIESGPLMGFFLLK